MSELRQKPRASDVKILYGNGSVSVETNGEIAAFEIDYIGRIQAVKKLGDGWTIKTSDSKIIIFSFAATELTELLFTYIGELEITGCSYSDWDGKVMKAKVLNQNQDKWNINFGTFGSDARKPEEIETRKIIGRKVRKSII